MEPAWPRPGHDQQKLWTKQPAFVKWRGPASLSDCSVEAPVISFVFIRWGDRVMSDPWDLRSASPPLSCPSSQIQIDCPLIRPHHCLAVYVTLCLPVSLCACMSIFPYHFLYFCLFSSLSFCLSDFPSVCLFVCVRAYTVSVFLTVLLAVFPACVFPGYRDLLDCRLICGQVVLLWQFYLRSWDSVKTKNWSLLSPS